MITRTLSHRNMSQSSEESARNGSKRMADNPERRATKSKRSRYVMKACNECKRRKVKCDGDEPCGQCSAQLTECSYRPRPLNNSLPDWGEFERMGVEMRSMRENLERVMHRLTPRSTSENPVESDVASGDDEASKDRRLRGRIKSCTQCRQHKLRCSACQHPGAPCSRCLKMGLECVVTNSWEPTNKRTKTQLAQENNELRKQLSQRTMHINQPLLSSPRSETQESARNDALMRDSNFLSITSHEQTETTVNPPVPDPNIAPSMGISLSFDDLDTLDGLPMASTNACLQLFFKHYAYFLPGIFDSDISLLRYHHQSSFLFWTMVCTGARRFQDVGFFQRAGSKVRDLMSASLLQIQDAIPTIQAILILCLWPLPVDSMWKDPSHALAGAAMQLAVQNGLHKFRHEQDFRRIQINSNDRIRVFRVYLWLNCIIVFQRTSIQDGLPFSALLDSWSAETEASLELVENQRLICRYKLHRVQTRAIAAITQYHDLQEGNDFKGLSALINVFDAQVQEIDASSSDITIHLAAKFVRLSLLAFHLFGAESDVMVPGAVCLFTVCTEILDLATRLDATQSLAWYSTNYHLRMILLAGFCVLRIMRSRLRDMIVINDAEQSLFKAINFVRSRSTQPFDLDARYAIILKQLYSSSDSFRRDNGEVDGLYLDVRSRLFMSIAFDSFWWWRAEFDGCVNPYRSPTATATNVDSTAPVAMQRGSFSGEIDPTMTLSNDSYDPLPIPEDFANWHWPAGLTFEDGLVSLPPLY